jgi:hypothetical protein
MAGLKKIKMNTAQYITIGKTATTLLQAFGLTIGVFYIIMSDALPKYNNLVLTAGAVFYTSGKQLENRINNYQSF